MINKIINNLNRYLKKNKSSNYDYYHLFNNIITSKKTPSPLKLMASIMTGTTFSCFFQ